MSDYGFAKSTARGALMQLVFCTNFRMHLHHLHSRALHQISIPNCNLRGSAGDFFRRQKTFTVEKYQKILISNQKEQKIIDKSKVAKNFRERKQEIYRTFEKEKTWSGSDFLEVGAKEQKQQKRAAK